VTNSIALVKEVASVGRQCTLLPRFAIQREVEAGKLCAIAVKEFSQEALAFCVCERSDRTLSPAAKVFVAVVVDYCRRFRR
jgi:DNA-binding transcriptional LysR family regulator